MIVIANRRMSMMTMFAKVVNMSIKRESIATTKVMRWSTAWRICTMKKSAKTQSGLESK